jgi:hypothetical protein
VAAHDRVVEPIDARVTLPEHRPPRSAKVFARSARSPEERELTAKGAEVTDYVALLKKRGRSLRVLRRLLGMIRDYPREPLLAAIRIATHYGLDDMERLESLVLRHIAGDFFPLPEAASGERGDDGKADCHDDCDDPGNNMPEGDDTTEPEDDNDR